MTPPTNFSPNITTSASPVSVALIDDRQKFATWARTAEGQRVIVEVVQGNKLALGLAT